MEEIAIATIAAANYMPYVRVLFESVRALHPEVSLQLLLVDQPSPARLCDNKDWEVTPVSALGIPQFEQLAFMYDVTEFNTAVKPFYLRFLLQRQFKKIIYLDPDVLLLSSLQFVFNLLDHHAIILTPHITKPVPCDGKGPSEITFLNAGTYNLGFIALAQCEEVLCMLTWWSSRCAQLCFAEPESGLFVDQKWVNLIPGLFGSVYVLRHLGCNMAYWNLHERTLRDGRVNDEADLVFYHFSGFTFENIDLISRYQNRYTLASKPDLRALFEDYKGLLIRHGYLDRNADAVYAYGKYDNGQTIGPVARRLYSHVAHVYQQPFATVGEGSFYQYLIAKGLNEGKVEPSPGWNSSGVQRKAKWFNRGLLLLMKVLGIRRYVALMQYLRYISVIRRQDFLIK